MSTRLVCAGVLIALVAPAAAQIQPNDHLEAIMLIAGDRDRTHGIPIDEERLTVAIDGQHASTTLLQTYQNATSSRIEGHYQLRPGSGTHVDGFAYWNGETKIVGEVFEIQTARQVYDRVTARRRDPGLLESDGEGSFAFKVFPIEPNEKKRVEVRWNQWLDRHGQTVRYHAPISRSDAEIVVSMVGPTKNLRSSTHKLHVEKVAGGQRIRFDGASHPTELVLEWDVDEPDWTPSAYVQAGAKEQEGWFALSLPAPNLPANAVAAKDVTIVIDRSGSMIGEKLEHAKVAATNMIRLLNKDDRVNVISFSDEVDPLFATPQPVDVEIRKQASAFVDKLHDGGGTDIALALSTAIKSQDRKSERPRVVVFLTDGQSEADQAMAAAKADTGDIRLFTLGLGADVNRPLLSRLAAVKRGRFVYIENAKAIEFEVGRLAASISKPLLVDISVDVEGAQAVRLYPRSLPDLFAEDELVVSGRIRGTGTAKFIVHGKLAGKAVAFSQSVDIAKAPSRPWVGGMWAQSRVEHLLEEIALGANKAEYIQEVTELALAYNFVTPYTAFLAVPESELGDMRDTVVAARERKKKIMANNPDVAGLEDHDQGVPRGLQRFAKQGGDDEADASPDSPRQMSAPLAPAEYATVAKRGACAGCATTGSDQIATGFLVGICILVIRRRRRQRR